MRKAIKLVLLIVILLVSGDIFVVTAHAEEAQDQLDSITDSISSQLGAAADDDTMQVIGDLELDVGSEDSVSGLSLPKILSEIFRQFYSDLRKPAAMLGKLIAAVLLCALAQGMTTASSDMTDVYKTISVLVGVLAIYDCINDSISGIVSALDRLSTFMLSYIPIYASVTAATGNYTSATSFYGSNLFLCEVIAFISTKALLPLLSVLTAFSISAAVNKDIKLGSAAGTVKTAIRWTLGITMTVFGGLLTIQSAVGSASDSVRSRTIRFAATSFIPIIGGSVSESYSAIKGSLHVIRSGAGAIGIVLIAATVLYPIITVLAVRAVIALGKFICDIFGQEDMSSMLSSMNDILAIGMSILICFSMMFIISTAIIMLTVVNSGV